MRVLILTPDFPPLRGGIQTLSAAIDERLRRAGHDVQTITIASDDSGADGVERVPARAGHKAAVLALNAAGIRALRQRPDVILAMHVVLAPALWWCARRGSAARVLYVHAKELAASPWLSRLAIGASDGVVAVSEYGRELAVAAGAPSVSVVVIHPGVELPDGHGASERAARPTILTVSRLDDAHKGHDVALAALPLIRKRVPDAVWVVIGDGRLRADLETAVRAHGLAEAVQFLGEVSDAERDRWFERAHVFLMASRVPRAGGGEGFGIVHLEAAARGLPSVAGNEGGATSAVLDGETGLLVDPRDPRAIADAVSALLTDPTRRDAMGERARAWALEHDWSAVIAKLEGTLAEAVAARR